jgi:uncharacterized protein with PIN domain
MSVQPRFIIDVNVGRLAKWLRIMGYDTLFPEETSDNELVRIALREDRVLVTRDAGIARRRAARLGQMRVVQIKKDDLRSQLQQLVRDLDLNLDNGFSRCVLCNHSLDPVDKENIAHRLPPYVLQTQSQFMQCPQCQRLYWRGTHWSNMMDELGQVYQEI